MSKELETHDLASLISGYRVRLDCGHFCTVGHNLANTLVIVSIGGGRIQTYCHNCY